MSGEYSEYLRDESRATGYAESISFPRSEDEVVAILDYFIGSGTTITVQGARTGLAAGAVPRGGHVLNLGRMNEVTGCRTDEAGHFFFTVQPGVILSQLKKCINSKKFDISGWSERSRQAFAAFSQAGEQFFPTDPTESSATIGGMVACNASGARSFFYGPTRKHITALRVVLSGGKSIALRRGEVFADLRTLTLVTEQGDTVKISLPTFKMPKVKNTSGYHIEDNMDAIDLFIGSDGTLGVITEIEVALTALPAVIWGTTCFFTCETNSMDFVSSIRQSIPDITAIEFFDGDALRLLQRQKMESTAFAQLPGLEDWMEGAVYVELHCNDEKTAIQRLFEIGRQLEQAGGREQNTWVARNQSDLDRLLFFRHAIPESVNMLIDRRRKENPAITKLASDMSVPDDQLACVMQMYRSTLRDEGLESAIWGHIGNNHLHVNILPRDKGDYLRGKELFARWAVEVTHMGGAVSAEHGIGKLKTDYLALMYGESHITEMTALKKTVDPAEILGAGNLFALQKEVSV